MNYEQQKRILDVVGAIFLIAIFLPFWVIVPLLIFFDMGLPIFFRHKRVGKGGKEFYIYKFRSMVRGAHKSLHEGNPKLLEEFKKNDWKFSTENDPRITRLGRILRSLTIDEFPQAFNVLAGDMSIVGPRAYMKKELNEQGKKYPSTKKLVKKILTIKPGVTGPWQVSGRNKIPFKKRAIMDAKFANNKDIRKDIEILLKTPKAMLSKW